MVFENEGKVKGIYNSIKRKAGLTLATALLALGINAGCRAPVFRAEQNDFIRGDEVATQAYHGKLGEVTSKQYAGLFEQPAQPEVNPADGDAPPAPKGSNYEFSTESLEKLKQDVNKPGGLTLDQCNGFLAFHNQNLTLAGLTDTMNLQKYVVEIGERNIEGLATIETTPEQMKSVTDGLNALSASLGQMGPTQRNSLEKTIFGTPAIKDKDGKVLKAEVKAQPEAVQKMYKDMVKFNKEQLASVSQVVLSASALSSLEGAFKDVDYFNDIDSRIAWSLTGVNSYDVGKAVVERLFALEPQPAPAQPQPQVMNLQGPQVKAVPWSNYISTESPTGEAIEDDETFHQAYTRWLKEIGEEAKSFDQDTLDDITHEQGFYMLNAMYQAHKAGYIKTPQEFVAACRYVNRDIKKAIEANMPKDASTGASPLLGILPLYGLGQVIANWEQAFADDRYKAGEGERPEQTLANGIREGFLAAHGVQNTKHMAGPDGNHGTKVLMGLASTAAAVYGGLEYFKSDSTPVGNGGNLLGGGGGTGTRTGN